MRYAEVVQRLYGLSPRGMRLGLGRMRRACALRGHPERATPVVHVAGTNGKGSLVATLDAVLGEAGYKVGAFTSPHLHHYTERFRIGGVPVSRRRLAARASELLAWLDEPGTPRLTFFEVSSLLAFELFRDAGCDVALIEVGLGGRLDSTNVVRPALSVITQIGLDHADRLGSTLAQIAGEKAGIVKRGVPVVVGTRAKAAQRRILQVARERAAPALCVDRDFGVEPGPRGLRLWSEQRVLKGVRPALVGAHQHLHLASAYACLGPLREAGFAVSPAQFRRGVRRVTWPARLEWLPGRPRVLLDAAHNPQGAQALAAYLGSLKRPAGKVVLLFGAMADKPVGAMLRALRAPCDAVVVTCPPGARAAEPSAFARREDGIEPDPHKALARAERLAGPRGWVVAAGSIFLVAAVRARRLGIRPEPAVRL